MKEGIVILFAFAVLLWLGITYRSRLQKRKRERIINNYRFPDSIVDKIRKRYPHLTDDDLQKVNQGLREYFQICNLAGKRLIAMPSQVVDVAWHEFILFTRLYQKFCADALGRFLHHTPAEAMSRPQSAQDGIKRAWRLSCHRSGIDPKSPTRLPLLFGIDADLVIPDGFTYALDCTKPGADGYCAGHISCSSGCAGDSGGCGGDGGCGGGCGGD